MRSFSRAFHQVCHEKSQWQNVHTAEKCIWNINMFKKNVLFFFTNLHLWELIFSLNKSYLLRHMFQTTSALDLLQEHKLDLHQDL